MATSKRTTKKDLENKIAQLEAKLTRISTQLEKKKSNIDIKQQSKPADPAKKEKGSLPKGFELQAPTITDAKTQTTKEMTVESDPLEHAYQNSQMTDFHQYRAKVTGYTPAPNRYFVRRTAPVGTVATTSWHLQKAIVAGYTQPSNQYFATRARLAYHPPEKTFTGYDISFGAGSAQTRIETVTTPQKTSGTLPKGF